MLVENLKKTSSKGHIHTRHFASTPKHFHKQRKRERDAHTHTKHLAKGRITQDFFHKNKKYPKTSFSIVLLGNKGVIEVSTGRGQRKFVLLQLAF